MEGVQELGDRKLSDIKTLCGKVSQSTSEKGRNALDTILISMEDAWNIHSSAVGK